MKSWREIARMSIAVFGVWTFIILGLTTCAGITGVYIGVALFVARKMSGF